MFSSPVPDIETLKERIMDALATVTEEMLEKILHETEHCLDILLATNGAQC